MSDTYQPDARRPALALSKLEPPRVFREPVRRSRVAALLAPGAAGHVTLVHAPAGFGKTTVLREAYLSRRPDQVAWLTIDAADNDPGRLLYHFLAALGDSGDQAPSENAGFDKLSTSATQMARLTELVRALPDDFAIYLDDLDQLTDPAALGVVAGVMQVLPNACSLVIGSRTYPELPFGRLRMHGRLREITASDLRFALDEVEEVLRRELPGQRWPHATAERLCTATEGWIGSIQMAILSLRTTPDREGFLANFNGSNTELAEYLAEDLLARQTPDVQEFLLATSALDQFSAELCDTVLERSDSAAILQGLARANMFIFSYDQEKSWFRYHNLFRSFLSERAAELGAKQISALHRRAALWFSQHGRPSTAISYALASGDHTLAGELIDNSAMDFFYSGRLSTIARWVAPLPASVRDRYPRIMLAYAWSLLALQMEPDTVQALVEGLERRNDLSRELRNEIIYLGPFHAALQDRLEDLDSQCMKALGGDAEASAFSRGVLWNIACYAKIHKQDFPGAIEAARAARLAHLDSGSAYGLAYAECFIARIEMLCGRGESALSRIDTALEIAAGGAGETMPAVSATALAIRLAYETGRDDEALEDCAEWGPLIEQLAPPHEIIDYFMVQADLAFDRGDRTAAYRLLNQLRQFGRARGHGRMVATAWAMQAQMAARRGDVAAARDYLAQAGHSDSLRRFDSGLVAESMALVEMMAGKSAEARRVLEAAEAEARRKGAALTLARLRVLRVELELQTGDAAVAEAAIAEVLELVCREKIMRPVLRAPEATQRAFVRHAVSRGIELPPGLLVRLAPAGTNRAKPLDGRRLPLEPLSRRELQVLRELAKGLSNLDIAKALSISLPTVKTHLRSMNGKLMAANRTEAAATARRLGLISDA